MLTLKSFFYSATGNISGYKDILNVIGYRVGITSCAVITTKKKKKGGGGGFCLEIHDISEII